MRISDWSSDVCSSDLLYSYSDVVWTTADGLSATLKSFTAWEYSLIYNATGVLDYVESANTVDLTVVDFDKNGEVLYGSVASQWDFSKGFEGADQTYVRCGAASRSRRCYRFRRGGSSEGHTTALQTLIG